MTSHKGKSIPHWDVHDNESFASLSSCQVMSVLVFRCQRVKSWKCEELIRRQKMYNVLQYAPEDI
jgi:hypothetical protein